MGERSNSLYARRDTATKIDKEPKSSSGVGSREQTGTYHIHTNTGDETMNNKTTITCKGCGASTWYSTLDPWNISVRIVDAHRVLEEKCACVEA